MSYLSGQFECIVCKKLVKQKGTKAHKKKKCTISCDGIQKDKGGYPLDPELRKKYLDTKKNKIQYLKPKKTDQLKNNNNSYEELIKLDPYRSFYYSREWLELRFIVMRNHVLRNGKRCQLCGETKGKLHVDHIKPRSKYPELELEISNLQVLCKACNIGKSNKDETDFRNIKKN